MSGWRNIAAIALSREGNAAWTLWLFGVKGAFVWIVGFVGMSRGIGDRLDNLLLDRAEGSGFLVR